MGVGVQRGGMLNQEKTRMPKRRLELPRCFHHMNLNHARLPVPPLGHASGVIRKKACFIDHGNSKPDRGVEFVAMGRAGISNSAVVGVILSPAAHAGAP